MDQRPAESIITVIEEGLGRPLDPELLSDVGSLSLNAIVDLKHRYDEYAAQFEFASQPADEFWPILRSLVPRNFVRDRSVANEAVERAMSLLLYAHGAAYVDNLGDLLTRAINPTFVGDDTRPRWAYRADEFEIANHLEALVYLRPLVDAGILILIPQPGFRLDDADQDLENFPHVTLSEHVLPGAATEWASEFVVGGERHAEMKAQKHEFFAAGGSFWRSPISADEHESIWTMMGAFVSLHEKLAYLGTGVPGDLSLEGFREIEAFDWLVRTAVTEEPAKGNEIKNIAAIERFAAPGITGLDPADIVALHQSDVWFEYRLALKRGLERASLLREPTDSQSIEPLREELSAAYRAARRTTKGNRFLEERARARRDVVIGAAVAAGMFPITGPAGSGIAFGGATARSSLALLWSWLGARRAKAEAAMARCFGAFSDPGVTEASYQPKT